MERTFEAELPPDVRAPSKARRLITDWFSRTLKQEELEKARLLVSELVSNAVRHGEPKIGLHADLDRNRLLVEVTDEGSGFERAIRNQDLDRVEGWGLRIVDATASCWGTYDGTTHVWFELERRGPRLGTAPNPAS